MGRAFSDIAFTPTVREMQTRMGSRASYAPLDRATDRRDRLTDREAEYIAEADHFYQATVGESGWPYVQHRGGPAGFLRVLDDKTLGFADFRGNVQYVSVGNLAADDRIALILMDYANQRRLKILGRARTVEAAADPALIERLRMPGYDGRIERAILITVEAYDWNCPQHITPRFTEAEIDALARPLRAELARLKEKLARSGAADAPDAFGNGPLELTIVGIRQLTPRVRAYELARADGEALPEVAAGAHLDVPMRLPDGTPTTRRYSIASDPGRRDAYEIAVLREDAGRGASAAVHADFRLGSVLHCGMPGNDFELRPDDQLTVLLAGGIGITPIKVMAQTLSRAGRRYHLHYAVRSRRDAAFADRLLAELGGHMTMHSAADGGRLDVARVVAEAAPGSAFYVCGPERLIEAARAAVRRAGIADERFHAERFVAATARDDDRPMTVTLRKSGKEVRVPANVSILDAVQAAGIDAPASCRIGDCSTCAVKVLAGAPDHRDLALTNAERDDERLMCICVSRALTPDLALDL